MQVLRRYPDGCWGYAHLGTNLLSEETSLTPCVARKDNSTLEVDFRTVNLIETGSHDLMVLAIHYVIQIISLLDYINL